jgi:hypothetical protein
VAVVLAVLVLGGAVALWRTSAVVGTTAEPSAAPVAPPPDATGVPAAFAEVWRARSDGTPVPVVAGPAVVTADGARVVGRNAVTGTEQWSYARDRTLCTIGAGFPGADGGGRVLALYMGGSGDCSELTALRPDTGARAAASNPDVRPGTRLLASGSSVVATGTNYLEVMRSDLVKTLEYGHVRTPVQVGRQPRPDCLHGSTALGSGRLGVVERCPGEATDRLSVMAADSEDDAEEPQVEFSAPLPAAGATVIAISAEREAVALPGPPRLELLDRTGQQVGLIPLDVPDLDLATDPPGGLAPVSSDGERVYWWTGSQTIALDATDLTPLWSVPGALGPAVAYGGSLLVPVPGGLQELDATSGTPRRTLPVAVIDGPVRLAVIGDVLLAQRGDEVVALRPAG